MPQDLRLCKTAGHVVFGNGRSSAFSFRMRPPALIWVVVKIRVPLWVPNIIRYLIFRVPKNGP